jgi:hypothetical protein
VILKSENEDSLNRYALLIRSAVRSSPRLAWDALIALYGDESLLQGAIDNLRKVGDTEDLELLEQTRIARQNRGTLSSLHFTMIGVM